jgi:UDP-N-acetylglucosamine--N-acetylmuramyl-(pentapeptide) pyrophosphoryl-undecaprenol N-acetylglucosamine transferase
VVGRGHIYPAIAIANELKTRFLMPNFFVGAQDKMEMQKYLRQVTKLKDFDFRITAQTDI